MWRYGRGRPRMVSIAEAERIRSERPSLSESRLLAAETRKRRSEAAVAAGAPEGPADLSKNACYA